MTEEKINRVVNRLGSDDVVIVEHQDEVIGDVGDLVQQVGEDGLYWW